LRSCLSLPELFFQADKAVAEEKLEAARPALEEAEAALQVNSIFVVLSLCSETKTK